MLAVVIVGQVSQVELTELEDAIRLTISSPALSTRSAPKRRFVEKHQESDNVNLYASTLAAVKGPFAFREIMSEGVHVHREAYLKEILHLKGASG